MTIITNEGKKLITHAIINKLDLFISKVVYADCNLDTLDETTTTLTNIKYENLPTSVRIDELDNSKIILEAVLRNDTAQDFFINCVGFVAKNGELLCFTKTNRTPVLSKVADTNASLFHYKLAIKLENANDLNIKIDETIVYPTLSHFNASQKAQDEKIDKLASDKVNINDFTTSQSSQDNKISALETSKADKNTTYTKVEVDTSQNAQDIRTTANEINTQKLISDLALEVSRLKTAVSLRGGVGMIYMFSGATENIPSNFMLCDGRELSKAEYPQLFNAIGAIYGESADTLSFKIPDLRGCFTRCVGGNANVLGVKQGDAIRNIEGSITVYTDNNPRNKGTGAFSVTSSTENGESCRFTGVSPIFHFNASRVVPIASENRPINMALNYVIQISE